MYFNQILSKFAIYYPEYIHEYENKYVKKRRKFRKFDFKYIINDDNRLVIKNPLKNKNNETELFKIPLKNEKLPLVKNFLGSNNHCGREQTVHLLYGNKWHWHDI